MEQKRPLLLAHANQASTPEVLQMLIKALELGHVHNQRLRIRWGVWQMSSMPTLPEASGRRGGQEVDEGEPLQYRFVAPAVRGCVQQIVWISWLSGGHTCIKLVRVAAAGTLRIINVVRPPWMSWRAAGCAVEADGIVDEDAATPSSGRCARRLLERRRPRDEAAAALPSE